MTRRRATRHAQARHGHGHGPATRRPRPRFRDRHRPQRRLRRRRGVLRLAADSLALLADAGHNLGDVARPGPRLGGRVRRPAARPDARHTYGWKRASILAAFANSLLLLVAIGSLAWEAIGRLAAPAPIAGRHGDGRRRHRHRRQRRTALLFLRGRHDDLNVRGAFLHMAATRGLGRRRRRRRAHALARLDLARSGLPAWRSRSSSCSAPGACSASRCTSCSTACPKSSTCMRCAASSRRCPASTCVHDLHVWATGTTETALTAHLAMPAGHPGRRVLPQAATERLQRALRDRPRHACRSYDEPLMTPCDGRRPPAPAAAAGGRDSH